MRTRIPVSGIIVFVLSVAVAALMYGWIQTAESGEPATPALPLPTFTPTRMPVATFTPTAVQPGETSTLPTDTPEPASATETPVPPTNTPTAVQPGETSTLPTDTPEPASATETPVTPTDTPTATVPSLTETPTATPESAATPLATGSPTATPTAQPVVIVNVNVLNVRREPNTDSDVLGAVTRGERLTVLDRTDEGDWLQVLLPSDQIGWVSAPLVLPAEE